jgi:hypothetical protein
MSPTKLRRGLLLLAMTSTMPLALLGCPNKDKVVDAGAPAPTPTPTPTPSETVHAPLEEDAGADADADADAGKPKWTGPGMNVNQARAKQCCNALRTQAKSLGNSPEAAQLNQAAMLCDGVAMQLGPTAGGQAPEFAAVRALLQGKTIPPVCQGL